MRKEDYHLHTDIIGCADETMRVPDIAVKCAGLGIEAIAITDHLNHRGQLPKHLEIRRQVEELEPKLDIYFGAEVNFDGPKGNFCYDEAIINEYGFQFAIGGIHQLYTATNIDEVADEHHAHHLLTCRHPLVDVLVHPWWFWAEQFGEGKIPWPEDLSFLKERHVRELGETAVETNTAIEINASVIFCDKPTNEKWVASFKQYFRELMGYGVNFAVGSDAHSLEDVGRISLAWGMLEELGVPEERVWKPKGEPLVKAV